ncbi:MAG TPA: PDZ domain-containing protein [Bacteroidales bacterium]|nr:PDZ domain-containing protein [Bacteroidales bacterium]
MKNPRVPFILIFLLCFVSMISAQQSYYLSTNGKDSNPGTFQKPFATLERAQKAVMEIHKRKAVTIYLRGGIYYLPETFVITPKGSGTKTNPVIYKAYGNEEPVISGGSRLYLQWKPYQNKILKATLPVDIQSDQFFVNGERQSMARYPNFNPKATYFDGFSADAFSAAKVSNWKNPENGYIHAMHPSLWGDFHYLITGKDTSNVLSYVGGWQNNRKNRMHPTIRFVENIMEELDTVGEWYLDGKTKTLYFYPPKDLDMRSAVTEVVRLKHLIEFKGTSKNPVEFVSFKGITFRHSARSFMENKEPLLRSDWTTYRGGAILLTGTENCSIEDCTLDQLGGNGIFVNNYNRKFVVRGCHLINIGSNGIAFIGNPKAVRSPLFEYHEVNKLEDIDRTPGPQSPEYPSDCLVENCLIHRTGRFEKQTAPIQIEMSSKITIRHCSIYDVPRAGINIGDGCWGGHLVEFCDIFETVKETGDHGSFNSWGRDRYWKPDINEVNAWVRQVPELPFLDVIEPNILRNNRWRCDHGWDIDLDDGSSNYRIYNNLCLNGGIKNREGFHRVVENNIIVNNGFHPHCWFDNSGDIFQHNIVWNNYKPARMYDSAWGYRMDSNFVQIEGKVATPSVILSSKSKRDTHSMEGDAMFIDPEKGDFRVKSGSPVLTLGFRNFPMNQFGVTKPSLKAIAKTPEMPVKRSLISEQKRDLTPVTFLGVSVRNISDEGEMSSYGLPDISGLLVLTSAPDSPLYQLGIRPNDVILSVNGIRMGSINDLSRVQWSESQSFILRISRNQKVIELKN